MGLPREDQPCQGGSWGTQSALLHSQMPACTSAPRAGLPEETGNSSFFCVLRNVFLSLKAPQRSAVRTDSKRSHGDASPQERGG